MSRNVFQNMHCFCSGEDGEGGVRYTGDDSNALTPVTTAEMEKLHCICHNSCMNK